MYVVLVYDIRFDDTGRGQKVLRKVFNKCKQYLHHVQNSVFEGNLSKPQVVELQKEMERLIRSEVDSVILFTSDNENWLKKKIIGADLGTTSNML